jgi:hypothetical protein
MLQRIAQMMSFCLEGATLTFQTHSMYEGLARSDCMEPWHRMMRHVESGKWMSESSDLCRDRRGNASVQGSSNDVSSGGG